MNNSRKPDLRDAQDNRSRMVSAFPFYSRVSQWCVSGGGGAGGVPKILPRIHFLADHRGVRVAYAARYAGQIPWLRSPPRTLSSPNSWHARNGAAIQCILMLSRNLCPETCISPAADRARCDPPVRCFRRTAPCRNACRKLSSKSGNNRGSGFSRRQIATEKAIAQRSSRH